MLLGYSKMTSMLSTIGGILVGNVANLYGSNIAGYITYLNSNMNENIIVKLVFLILSIVLLALFNVKTAKIEKVKDIKLYEKTTKKVKTTKGIVTLVLMFIILSIAMYNWSMSCII
jgi:cadmium resistance protein CadD (predicted permease)